MAMTMSKGIQRMLKVLIGSKDEFPSNRDDDDQAIEREPVPRVHVERKRLAQPSRESAHFLNSLFTYAAAPLVRAEHQMPLHW
jgi:hypothetical protein